MQPFQFPELFKGEIQAGERDPSGAPKGWHAAE
jgi:hypothetical protein